MTDLKTTFAGLQLKNPIIISSSGLTNSAGKNKKLAEAGAGAIVLKSLFEEQIFIEADQLKDPTYSEGNDYLAEYIREHKLSEYLELIKESKRPMIMAGGGAVISDASAELKEFVEQWDIIMEGYQNITKKFLEKARINMNEARDGLYLAYVQNEENKQAIAYFEGKERMAALREHIEQVTGRQVKIELKVVSKNSEAAQEIEANDLSKINFAIQYE